MEAPREEERNSAKTRVVRVQKGPYRSAGLRCTDR